MNDWLRLFLLPLAGGIVGIAAAFIFSMRKQGDTLDRDQRAFGIHAWYVTSIISFLLICALAVDWGSIPELATILSFAVGLASLILALIAIIQTLTSTGNVEAALAAVRRVAENAGKSGENLAVSVDAIRDAAQNAQLASSSALKATEKLSALGGHVIRSNEEGRVAIESLIDEIKLKNKADSSKQDVRSTSEGGAHAFVNGVSMGGAIATYAAVRAFETKRSFSWKEVFPDSSSTSFENGYIAALDDLGLVTMKRIEGKIEITNVKQAIADSVFYIKSKTFDKEAVESSHKHRIAQIEAYFSQSYD